MSELKPCPFCGGTASVSKYSRRGGSGGCELYDWHVYCLECGCQTDRYTDAAIRDEKGIRLTSDGRQKAIEHWNSRRK